MVVVVVVVVVVVAFSWLSEVVAGSESLFSPCEVLAVGAVTTSFLFRISD